MYLKGSQSSEPFNFRFEKDSAAERSKRTKTFDGLYRKIKRQDEELEIQKQIERKKKQESTIDSTPKNDLETKTLSESFAYTSSLLDPQG
ncbi:hypothetical protein MMC21_002158 [Puttea exsequens]|nr:hypothetical protein [Puttea exsequens]